MNSSKPFFFWLAAGTVAASSFTAGLFAVRVLFEYLFPSASLLGRTAPVLLITSAAALFGLLLWRLLSSRLSSGKWVFSRTLLSPNSAPVSSEVAWTAAIPYLPWLASLLYPFGRSADVTGGYLLFFGSLWLSTVFAAWILVKPSIWRWLGPLFLLLALVPVYLLTLGQDVGTADTFEFQVVVPKQGIVHPTGYPLYLMLAKVLTYLPINTVAWRVNLASAFFGLAAVFFLYWLAWRLLRHPLPALLAGAAFGLTPTFWSQAIEAEVYTLHALIVAAALFLMREIGDWRLGPRGQRHNRGDDSTGETTQIPDEQKRLGAFKRLRLFLARPLGLTFLLALVLGLGLANHLTTVILLPAAVLTVAFAYQQGRYLDEPIRGAKAAILVAVALLLPLLLYAYLPLRWAAVNGEPMGLERFLDWVVGGRFQGALQLTAWLSDGARYDVIRRLFEFEWQTLWTLSLIGAIWVIARVWRFGLILFLTWLGFVFYSLNYYVPDLAVFLIPAFLVTSIWLGAGIGALVAGTGWLLNQMRFYSSATGDTRDALTEIAAGVFGAVLLAVVLINSADRWAAIDASQDDGGTTWARAVLSGTIEEGAAILADSDKFPPLYYLQQVEDLRPDLDILLLPEEDAYRSELHNRLDAGQDVYLARYLPGLEGTYHLGSEGPLTAVRREAVAQLPGGIVPAQISFGPIQLLGYSLNPISPYASGEVAVTFFWTAEEPPDEVLQIYVRLAGQEAAVTTAGSHPANNYYPTVAWQSGEIVPDFHSLPVPQLEDTATLELQVALAPPFTPAADLEWRKISSVPLEPFPTGDLKPLRMQVGPNFLEGVAIPSQVRPNEAFSVVVTGTGADHEGLLFTLRPAGISAIGGESSVDQGISRGASEPFILTSNLHGGEEAGLFELLVSYPGEGARCGWLSPETSGCVLGRIEITGVPLPEGAHNFEDLIAMVDYELAEEELVPGGQVQLNLQWLALTAMVEDFTVFVQVLDSQDTIVGQVDSWPLQGTFPTSHWMPGERIDDPYLIQLDPELASGPYQIYAGFYLLETLQRLAVVDAEGAAIDDKVILSGLYVP